MSEQIISSHQLISINQLVRALKEGRSNSERFCFIIGSGASVSSGIPAGAALEYQWMEEMEKSFGLEEIRELAKTLGKHLEYDFEEIARDWERAKKSGTSLSSEYYFDIYKLRFFPNHRNGYHYLEKIMANKNPCFGYHPLALMLTDGTGSNLVITTNFDSLIEDALFLYTDDKPLVINHELLAEYAGDPNIKRPIIAKVHRGIFFDPLNQPEEINELKGGWRDVLGPVFQSYTPIVIGYGGGDRSLMKLLEDDNVKMKNGIYWCYYEKYGLPNHKIQTLVKKKNGFLVRTAGFDATMLAIGNALFPDKIGVHEAEAYLNRRTSVQIANYEKEYKRLTEYEAKKDEAGAGDSDHQSEDEFKAEIGKMKERSNALEEERQKLDRMTAWDYRRQGNRYYELKQYKRAVESYSKAIQMQANTAQFYNDRGCAYDSLGEHDKAITDFETAIELNPEDAAAYVNLGYAHIHLKEYDKAISFLNQAIKLDPEDALAYVNRGCVYDDLGEYDKAMSDFVRATELDPKEPTAYVNRGHIYNELKEYNKAIPEFDKAIELDPKEETAYNNRGYAYLGLKEYDKAAADLNKAIQLDPKDADPYENLGILWKQKSDLDKAIKFLSKAIELDSKHKEAYVERAEVYRALGELSKAEADEASAAAL